MIKYNPYLFKIEQENSFATLNKKVNEYKLNNPTKKIISLGIGDVSRPIPRPIIEEMHKAVEELSDINTFKGYGYYYGHDFLRQAILDNEYGVFNFTKDEIYISNGTKTDSTSILELFDVNAKILITNPTYPVYLNGTYALSREVSFLPIKEEDNFLPQIPTKKYDIIYLCSPNNPIGIAYTKEYLEKRKEYAINNNSIILYDNVYHDYITSPDVPKSIYELPNSKKTSIEFRSFSKSSSFTGVRCSYYIIPNDIDKDINHIWKLRTLNRFNGTDYIAQKGALASYDKESKEIINYNIKYYLDNAKSLKDTFLKYNFKVWGGIDSPFIWVKNPSLLTSWETFSFFLNELNIIVTPGIIFGSEADAYFRISSLGTKEDISIAIKRISDYYEKEI